MNILKSKNRFALLISFGLALIPLHNLWLIEHIKIDNQPLLFLPQIGAVIWILGTLFFLRDNFKQIHIFSHKIIEIPLMIITLSIGISGFINLEFAPFLFGIILLASFYTARILGKNLFYMLIPFVILGSIIAIINGLLHFGVPASTKDTYGLITNYCAYAGFLIFGSIVNMGKYQWILLIIALVGLFFIGALEAVFIVGIIGLTILIRRDFSKKLVIIFSVLTILVGIGLITDKLLPLYTGNHNIEYMLNFESFNNQTMTNITSGRWIPIVNSLQDIKFFGHGFTMSTVSGGIVHNLPLIILYQIGIIGSLAWTFVTGYCIVKSKYKYAWIALIAMCVFDHYIWTQFAPYWWILVGISLTSNINNDYIFKGK